MDIIFHEKQEGSLCAQHCLNALLQAPYFNPVDLANIAQKLDEAERDRMAEGGVDSTEYNQFVARPSSNMDDSGYFSVQVIEEALKAFNVRLVRFDSASAEDARSNPLSCTAFICNLMDHWLTIRKLGHQWFNLNSLLADPQLLSDTYLSMYLEQLRVDGYSIFVVEGDMPACPADEVLTLTPAVPPPVGADATAASSGRRLGDGTDDLSRALDLSRQQDEEQRMEAALRASQAEGDDDDESLRRIMAESRHQAGEDLVQQAIAMSLQQAGGGFPSFPSTAATTTTAAERAAASAGPDSAPSAQEVRQKRMAFFAKAAGNPPPPNSTGVPKVSDNLTPAITAAAPTDLDSMSEDQQLHYAMMLSQEQ